MQQQTHHITHRPNCTICTTVHSKVKVFKVSNIFKCACFAQAPTNLEALQLSNSLHLSSLSLTVPTSVKICKLKY